MKASLFLAACLSIGSTASTAQNVPKARPAPNAQIATKIDPAKEADIRKLLDLIGTKAVVVQTMDSMSKSIKPLLTSSLPPGDYREKLVNLFFAKFSAKSDVEHLLDLA